MDRTGTGEYRMARDRNEKNALATVSGFNTGGTGGLGNNQANYQREQDSPFNIMVIQKDLSTPPSVKFTDLARLAGSDSGVVLNNNPIEMDLRIDFFRQSDDHVITAFTIQVSNKDLKFDNAGGLQTATLNIFGRITAVSGKRSGIFEDSVTTNATNDELILLQDKKSVYQKAIALTPGTYKVDVIVRDVVTGNKGSAKIGFVVPRYDEKKLSTSSLVLASKLRSTSELDTGKSFVIGKTKVVPNLSGVYKQGQDIGMYLQVYNAEIDQTTLKPAVDVEYVLSKDGKDILRRYEDWSGLSDSGQRLTLARLFQTATLPLGDYEIKVLIKDRVGGQLIENKGKFTITQ